MPQPAYKFYVDEAGNAGANYLDAEQPFFVTAGVLLHTDRVDCVSQLLRDAARPAPELKGAKLLKRATGGTRATKLLGMLAANGCKPFFVIMDRRFSIAGKLVDVFLDPEHQDAVEWLPTGDIKKRKEIAEVLFDLLPEAALRTFAREYLEPSVDGFAAVLQTVIGELQAAGQPELAAAYRGAHRAVRAIVEAETYDKWSQGSHRQFVALNVPGCMHLLRLVDRFLDAHGRCCVEHDSTPEFETLLSHYVESITGGATEDYRLRDGTIYRAGFRNIEDFQIASSAASPPLQAADLLASAVGRIARAAITPDKSELKKLRGVAKLTLPALMYDDDDPRPQFAGAYMHDRTLAGLLARALFDRGSSQPGI